MNIFTRAKQDVVAVANDVETEFKALTSSTVAAITAKVHGLVSDLYAAEQVATAKVKSVESTIASLLAQRASHLAEVAAAQATRASLSAAVTPPAASAPAATATPAATPAT